MITIEFLPAFPHYYRWYIIGVHGARDSKDLELELKKLKERMLLENVYPRPPDTYTPPTPRE